MILQFLNDYLFVHIAPAGHKLLPLNNSARSFFPPFLFLFYLVVLHPSIRRQSVVSVPLQVCPAGSPQGMRGVPPLQLLPRGHRPHVDGLLRELHHLGAELCQRVERHDRPGDHAARLTHHVCRPVRPSAPCMSAACAGSRRGSNRRDPWSHQFSRGQTEQLLLLCLHPQSGFLMRWHQLISLCWHQSSADAFDSLCAGRRSGREQSVWSKPSCATSWRSRTWRTSPPRRYVSHRLIWFTWSSVHPVSCVTEVIFL